MKLKIHITILVILALFVAFIRVSLAETPDEKLERLKNEIQGYEQELVRLSSQANTLSNQIAQFDAQINLAQLKIDQTQEKIQLLGGRIDQLEVSLDSLGDAFSERARETYKLSRLDQPVFMLLSAKSINEAVLRFNYLKKVQQADRDLLIRLQKAQNVYQTEKTDQEDLEGQLKIQLADLDTQKAAKASLLQITHNDEKKYQQLLAAARAEIDAIQNIIAGKGSESEVGSVSTGEKIASVIPGSSACSSGGHLHFEVAKDNIHQNPANFLSNHEINWNNQPDSPFGFGGSWPWPLNDPIRITQGYGYTYYAATLNYYGGAPHTGIDMVNNGDYTVKAVQPGTLYRGSIACGGGTLRYVRVAQSDGYDTYYLHVNY